MNTAQLHSYADGRQGLAVNGESITHGLNGYDITMSNGTLDGTEALRVTLTFVATVTSTVDEPREVIYRPLNERDHDNQHCDHSIEGDLEEILSPHDFDQMDHPYWPEALHLVRAAERVAQELIRHRDSVVQASTT